ncbi:hypothetical protein F4677DRAFT_447183 [Hypoxylon crocopeplum]|nr:hypothetical protein F4677DRAFT_447183 [Hypoxylon crocopeplum]
MSTTGETLTLMMEDRVTFPKAPTAAAQTSAKGQRIVTKQPSEVSSSYFPEASSSPTSSSPSSETDEEGPTPITRANQMIGLNYPIPPLERQYSPPTGELDVARQLAMKPLPRSLHSSLQRAASASKIPVVENEEMRAKKLADAKRQLLALAGHI